MTTILTTRWPRLESQAVTGPDGDDSDGDVDGDDSDGDDADGNDGDATDTTDGD